MNFSLLDILTECGKNFIYVSYILYEVILINTREWRIIEQIEKYTWHAENGNDQLFSIDFVGFFRYVISVINVISIAMVD